MEEQVTEWVRWYVCRPLTEHEKRKPQPIEVQIPVEAPRRLFKKNGGRVIFTQMSIPDLEKLVVWLQEVIAWKKEGEETP